MAEHWRECAGAGGRQRDFSGEEAGGRARLGADDPLVVEWHYFVRVSGFTFQFATLGALREAIGVLSMERPRAPMLGGWSRHERNMPWVDRLPMRLLRKGKREEAVRALESALMEFEALPAGPSESAQGRGVERATVGAPAPTRWRAPEGSAEVWLLRGTDGDGHTDGTGDGVAARLDAAPAGATGSDAVEELGRDGAMAVVRVRPGLEFTVTHRRDGHVGVDRGRVRALGEEVWGAYTRRRSSLSIRSSVPGRGARARVLRLAASILDAACVLVILVEHDGTGRPTVRAALPTEEALRAMSRGRWA